MEIINRTRCIIVGAPRSGTTTLWRQLAHHPDISPSRIKELNYLHDQSLEGTAYDEHFDRGGLATVEASPIYFREHVTYASKLAETFPNARLVFILREPAMRLLAGFRSARDWDCNIAKGVDFAKFVHIIANDLDPLPIFPSNRERAVYATDAKKVGLYAKVLSHYLKFFDAKQMHIVFLDDLVLRPEATRTAICNHINVNPSLMPFISPSAENQGVEIGNHKLFTLARRVNVTLEPMLNRAPWLRAGLRSLHHAINAKPVDRSNKMVLAALQEARDWYAVPNRQLAELLRDRFPNVLLPIWLEDNH